MWRLVVKKIWGGLHNNFKLQYNVKIKIIVLTYFAFNYPPILMAQQSSQGFQGPYT